MNVNMKKERNNCEKWGIYTKWFHLGTWCAHVWSIYIFQPVACKLPMEIRSNPKVLVKRH